MLVQTRVLPEGCRWNLLDAMDIIKTLTDVQLVHEYNKGLVCPYVVTKTVQ